MIEPAALVAALVDHLPKQRWFGGDEAAAASLSVLSSEVLRSEWPALVHTLVQVPDHGSVSTYQVVLGLRPFGADDSFLEGKGEAVLGEVDTELGRAVAYDAMVDPELSLRLLERTAPDEEAERARLLGADQSNTSVVFDERLIMKLFRRVAAGANPDVEVTGALAAAGFGAVPRPVGEWEGGGGHLAVVTEFLAGGVDGFQLALTSLRDLYDAGGEPSQAGGDFGPDACRLGAIVAEMHVALAGAFGVTAADVGSWADDMNAQLARTPDVAKNPVAAVYETLRSVDAGPAIRVHGDLHLGQVMRTDTGWYVLDFEGEPARPLEERRRPSSALRDVAGMLRSFHYAPAVGRRDHGEVTEELEALGAAWERHNRDRFLEGYLGVDGIDAVLPPTERARALVLAAFELDKAVYEVAYEASHRPDWVGIPLSAVQRILEETARDRRTP
ncbi:MAG: aminoglycoside phosphotransferase [Actinomycetia bacterium]|nr:aminoglycoside phosphotransferase [Actinomycetes bacterium]